MKERHIFSMTFGQSALVRAAILPASREWAKMRLYLVGSITFAGAIADMERDCYIGVVDAVLFHQGSNRYSGTLTWDVDHTFAPAPASPTPALEVTGRWSSPELERVDARLLVDTEDADLLQERGYRLYELGRYEEALSALDASLRRDPRQPGAQYWLGRTFSRLDRHEDGLMAFHACLREEPRNPAALQALGISLHSLRRYAESLAAHDAAVAIDPGDADAHVLRGWTLDSLRRHDDGIAAYDAALRLAPLHPVALRRRALALVGTGRTAEAVTALRAALARNPGDPELSRALHEISGRST